MRLGFVLLSPQQRPIPSTRVAVLNILSLLRDGGHQADIVYEPATPDETPELPAELLATLLSRTYDVVVFQKVHGPSVLRLVRGLTSAGVKTAYLVCDLVDVDMAEQTDGTIVVTDFLRSLYPAGLAHKIHVVHDGIERPDVVKTAYANHAGTPERPLRAVLVTSAELDRLPALPQPLPAWLHITIVGAYPPRHEWRARLNMARWAFAGLGSTGARWRYLRFLSNRQIDLQAWDAQGVYRHLTAADVGIIPIDAPPWQPAAGGPPPAWMVKSENRLTLKMSVGLPVVASPIPAYEPVVEQGRNAYLARTPAQWLEQLQALRDPALRRRVGMAARESVLSRYSLRQQAVRLTDALQSIVARGDGQYRAVSQGAHTTCGSA